MKPYDTLIRDARWRIDETRRALADIQNIIDQLQREFADLEVQKEEEIALSKETGYSPALIPYLKAVDKRQEDILRSKKHYEAQADEIRDKIAIQFIELKKYDHINEQKISAFENEQRKRENTMFDEIALSQFIQKKQQPPHND